jgi:hypothetical protein
MEKLVHEESISLEKSIRRNAPFKMDGDFGPSELDSEVPELLELERIIRNPEAYGDEEDEGSSRADNAPRYQNAQKQTIDEIVQPGPETEKHPTAGYPEDPFLLRAIADLNSSSSIADMAASSLQSSARRMADSLDAVKYIEVDSPAVLNMSSKNYQNLLMKVSLRDQSFYSCRRFLTFCRLNLILKNGMGGRHNRPNRRSNSNIPGPCRPKTAPIRASSNGSFLSNSVEMDDSPRNRSSSTIMPDITGSAAKLNSRPSTSRTSSSGDHYDPYSNFNQANGGPQVASHSEKATAPHIRPLTASPKGHSLRNPSSVSQADGSSYYRNRPSGSNTKLPFNGVGKNDGI